MESALDIVNKFMETTIYDKAGFSPIILLLPLIEKKLPAYYEALDLDNLTKATVEHDATYIQNIIKTLEPIREKRKYYEEHPEEVDKILVEGTAKAREKAKNTMKKVKKAMKLDYFE